MRDSNNDVNLILSTIAQQYRIPVRKLHTTKLAEVVVQEVKRLNDQKEKWSAGDFNWDLLLDGKDGKDKIKPDLLEPSA